MDQRIRDAKDKVRACEAALSAARAALQVAIDTVGAEQLAEVGIVKGYRFRFTDRAYRGAVVFEVAGEPYRHWGFDDARCDPMCYELTMKGVRHASGRGQHVSPERILAAEPVTEVANG